MLLSPQDVTATKGHDFEDYFLKVRCGVQARTWCTSLRASHAAYPSKAADMPQNHDTQYAVECLPLFGTPNWHLAHLASGCCSVCMCWLVYQQRELLMGIYEKGFEKPSPIQVGHTYVQQQGVVQHSVQDSHAAGATGAGWAVVCL